MIKGSFFKVEKRIIN